MYFLQIFLIISPIVCWNLKNYNIDSNYYISSIAVYGNRAFLALSRSVCLNNVTNPTLVEVGWFNEQHFPVRKRDFGLHLQSWEDCNHIQDAISLDMERIKLWILDKGSETCPAKLVGMNVFQNSISGSCDLENISKTKLSTLVVDLMGSFGPRAYIGLKDSNELLIVSLNDLKWWKLVGLGLDSSQFLALSVKESVLFATGREIEGIFALDIENVRETEGPLAIEAQDTKIEINVTFLGNKLGFSSGLVSDFRNGLTYYIIRDYVIVRWDYRSPAQAEFYDILVQSYEVFPFVTQFFVDVQKGIWALVNGMDPEKCFQDNPLELKTRVVNLLKYNRIIKNVIF